MSGVEVLARVLERTTGQCELVGPQGDRIAITETVFYMLGVSEAMARGDAVTVVPVRKELTTQQEAPTPDDRGRPPLQARP